VHENPDYVRTASHADGAAYVVKACLASDLIMAIHEALKEHRFVSPIIPLEENPQNQSGSQKTKQPNVRNQKC
jgi:DNA-binding NarL/FixJ family response regulator